VLDYETALGDHHEGIIFTVGFAWCFSLAARWISPRFETRPRFSKRRLRHTVLATAVRSIRTSATSLSRLHLRSWSEPDGKVDERADV